MAIIGINLSDTIGTWVTQFDNLGLNVGDLTLLTTDRDSNLVAAINSLESNFETLQGLSPDSSTITNLFTTNFEADSARIVYLDVTDMDVDSARIVYLDVTDMDVDSARILNLSSNDIIVNTLAVNSKTITLGGNFTHNGAHTLTLTTTNNTSVTLPTTGTLATTGNLSQFASTTSAQLAGIINDETGTGSLVFGTSPTFTTSVIAGSVSMNLFNTTATTINFAGASTALTIGATTGTTTVRNDLSVTGDASATNFNSTSDIKFKENITTLENSIDILNNIRPVSFNWIGGSKSYGVIAQELENILPELVNEDKCGIKRVSYTPIIALLIDAIKAHEKEIQKLKNCQCSCK